MSLPPSWRQEAANENQQNITNLGFVVFCSRKAGQEARSFRKASRPPLGGTPAHSLNVHVGPPGLRSLHVRCASPSWLRLLP